MRGRNFPFVFRPYRRGHTFSPYMREAQCPRCFLEGGNQSVSLSFPEGGAISLLMLFHSLQLGGGVRGAVCVVVFFQVQYCNIPVVFTYFKRVGILCVFLLTSTGGELFFLFSTYLQRGRSLPLHQVPCFCPSS